MDKTGVCTGNSVGKGAIYESTTNNNNSIGVQIGGLSVGTYQVYVAARNTNNNSIYNQLVYAGSSDAGGFAYSGTGTAPAAGFTEETLSFSGASNLTSWVNGSNMAVLTVTLGAGQYLDVAVGDSSASSAEYRGFFNSLEIVQIAAAPEPGTVSLMALSFITLLLMMRYRRPFLR